jgi:hypothetical protein
MEENHAFSELELLSNYCNLIHQQAPNFLLSSQLQIAEYGNAAECCDCGTWRMWCMCYLAHLFSSTKMKCFSATELSLAVTYVGVRSGPSSPPKQENRTERMVHHPERNVWWFIAVVGLSVGIVWHQVGPNALAEAGTALPPPPQSPKSRT